MMKLQNEMPDRRSDLRFPVSTDLEYWALRNGVPIRHGTGRLLNLSRKGVLFQSDSRLPIIGEIEMTTAWPPFCREEPRLWLHILARIVRSSTTCRVAAEIIRYDFVPSGRRFESFTHSLQSAAKN